MFTFIGLIHLAILTHHHINIHNDTDNNNITVLLHIHKECLFFLPASLEVALHTTTLYHALQGIYTVEKAALSNNFL